MDVKDNVPSSIYNIMGMIFALIVLPIFWFKGRSLLKWIYLIVSQFWWTSVCGSRPLVKFKAGSEFCERIVQACATLNEEYHPPLLWGKSGHIQTILFGSLGRFNVRPIRGERHSIILHDGSTVHYDVFEPHARRQTAVRKTEESSGDESDKDLTMLVCPGIGNSTDCTYVRAFSSHAVDSGFRVVVFNHLGALKTERITGNRIFSYGGTGDITAVFDEVCTRYPNTKFIGCGFSMGACILMRFLGEDKERQKKFICAASVCQGYDPTIATTYMHDWKNLRRLYNFGISRKQLSLIRRHSVALLPSEKQPEGVVKNNKKNEATKMPHSNKTFKVGKQSRTHSEPVLNYGESESLTDTSRFSTEDFSDSRSWAAIEYTDGGFTSSKNGSEVNNSLSGGKKEVSFSCGGLGRINEDGSRIKRSQSHQHLRTHGNFDNDGYCLNRDQIQPPDESKLWRITSLYELDEYFTRRVFGFATPNELYKWTSCIDLMFKIEDLPMLIVNTRDDPLVDSVDTNVLDIPMEYIEHNPNSLLVVPSHGGHLGFFEGGVIIPNNVTWIDRLLVQFGRACSNDRP